MIRHVVMWRLRGPSTDERREQGARISAALQSLRGKVPGMSALEVGLGDPSEDEQRTDVVLITTHDNWQALEAYQKHPDHQEVAALIGELRVERRVIDFES